MVAPQRFLKIFKDIGRKPPKNGHFSALRILRFFANILGYRLKVEKCYGGATHIYLNYRLIPHMPKLVQGFSCRGLGHRFLPLHLINWVHLYVIDTSNLTSRLQNLPLFRKGRRTDVLRVLRTKLTFCSRSQRYS